MALLPDKNAAGTSSFSKASNKKGQGHENLAANSVKIV
jgi:hypothetical protein